MKTKKILTIAGISILGIGAVYGVHRIIKKIRNKNTDDSDNSTIGGSIGSGSSSSSKVKRAHVGEEGYATVRETPEINDTHYWYGDIWDNIIFKAEKSPIGAVIGQKKDAQGHVWYNIQWTKPIKGKTKGWVRADVVTIKES